MQNIEQVIWNVEGKLQRSSILVQYSIFRERFNRIYLLAADDLGRWRPFTVFRINSAEH